MPKYVIERDLPGAGDLSAEELQGISAKSNEVIAGMQGVQWDHSYVTGDKIFCVYIAPNPESLQRHAKEGGFPINTVSEVATVIDPTTGGR